VLGPQVFDSAFREYTRRWVFKHPQPEDFFRTMEEVSGRDLAWFWRGFFYTTAALDQSVEGVKQEPDGSAQVTLVNLGDAVMPVELELGFDDGTTQLVKAPGRDLVWGESVCLSSQTGENHRDRAGQS
jgi:aminopeptidase N